MNTQELRELDAWIACNLFGAKDIVWVQLWAEIGCPNEPFQNHGADEIPYYTTAPAAAMEVMKKCLEKDSVGFWKKQHGYTVKNHREDCREQAPTLELAICLFAKKLFTKP